MATEFPIRFHHDLARFTLPSKIYLSGLIKEGAIRFEVDLRSADGEFLFHFNPRFNEDCIVRNSTKNGQQWQQEERDGGMPFSAGNPFNIEFITEESEIMCIVNGTRLCAFKARDDLNSITEINVVGDVQLNGFSVLSLGKEDEAIPPALHDAGGKEPRETNTAGNLPEVPDGTEPTSTPTIIHPAPVTGPQGQLPTPYKGTLEALITTNRMRVVGTPHQGAQRFTVNWKTVDGETLFHFNARLDQNCVVRNATVDKQYPVTAEERDGPGCPFHPGKQFALDFLLHGDMIRCFVDGIEFCRFQARDDLHKVAFLDIHGDLALDQILIA